MMTNPIDAGMEERLPDGASKAPEAFESEVLAHKHALLRLALHLSRDREEAEDVVQDALLKALHHWRQFEAGSNMKAWLSTILRNTWFLRSRRRRRELPFDPQMSAEVLGASSDPTIPMELDDVRRAMSLLPRRCRDVLVLAAGGSSYDEMSFILGCPVGTVKSRLSRARDLLQATLAQGDFKALAHCDDPAARFLSEFAALTR